MSAAPEQRTGPGGPLRRTREGLLRDPLRPGADGAALVRAGLRADRRFRVTDEETGQDCTVEVLAEFLLGACTRPAAHLLGTALGTAPAPGAEPGAGGPGPAPGAGGADGRTVPVTSG